MAGKQPILNYLPVFFTVLSFLLILITILPGVHHALLDMFYLKTDASNLSIPPKLSNSTFLKDLSTVSGTDFVGQDATASSLGLSETYFVYLLTSCGRTGSSTQCASPHVGFNFNAGADLKLDTTALQGSFDTKYLAALSSYSRSSGFIAAAYIVCCVVTILIPFLLIFAGHFPKVSAFAAVNAVIATLLLLAANIAAVVVYKNVNDTFNKTFADAGLSSTLGSRPFITSWVAFASSLLASIVYIIRAHNPDVARRRNSMASRSANFDLKPTGAVITGSESIEPEEGGMNAKNMKSQKPGFLARIPTWNRHTYVQVERQPALVRTDVVGREERAVVESVDGSRRPLDNNWAADDDYVGAGGIAMRSLGGSHKPRRDMSAAYEPYNSAM